jgi:hypothetical protein
MSTKRFFLIVFGLVFSLAIKAADTQKVVASLISNAPDIYYTGTTALSQDYIDNQLKPLVQFKLDDGTTVVTPTFTIISASASQTAPAPLIANGISISIKVDENQGYAFLPTGDPEGRYTATITDLFTIRDIPLTVSVAAGAVADKNYDGNKNATVDKSKITFVIDASANGAYLDASIGTIGGVYAIPASAYTATAEYNYADVATANSAELTIALNASPNYFLVSGSSPVTLNDVGVKINPLPLTIAGITFANTTKVYDGTPLTATGVTFAPALTPAPVFGTDYTVNTAVLPVDAGVFTDNVLNNIVTLNASFNPNYTLAAAANKVTLGTYQISKAPLAVTAVTNSQVYDATNTLFDAWLSTKDLGFTVFPDIAVTGSLSWAKNKNVGTYPTTIGDLASTDENYYVDATKFVPANLIITKLTVAITTDPATSSIAYGTATPALTPVFTPALPGDDTYSGTLKVYNGTTLVAPQSPLNVGSYNIGKTGDITLNTTNYTISSFTPGTLTVTSSNILTITPTAGQFKTYGEPDPTFTYTITGFVAPDTEESIRAILTGNLSYGLPNADAGSYALTLGNPTNGGLKLPDDNLNYTLALDASPVNFEIRKANVIVTLKALSDQLGSARTSFDYADVFDVTFVNNDVASTVFVGGETITRKGVGNAAATVNDPVGSYDYTVGTLATLTNYNLILATGTPAKYSITPAIIYVLPTPNQGKGYGEVDPDGLKSAYTVVDVSDTPVGGVTLSGELKRAGVGTAPATQNDPVGVYSYIVSNLTNPNYEVRLSATADEFTISKGVVEVDVKTGLTGTYGAAAVAFDASAYIVKPESLAGIITGNVKRSGAGNAPTVDPKANDAVGVYDILQGDLDVSDANYSLVFHPGLAAYTIQPKALKVTAEEGQKKVYGDEDPIFTYTVEGLDASDEISAGVPKDGIFTGALDRISGYNVGLYDIIAGSLAINNLNYTYNPTTGFTGNKFEITKAELTVEPSAGKSKIYGSPDAPADFTLADANVDGFKLGASTGLNVDDVASVFGASPKFGREEGEDVRAAGYKYNLDAYTLQNYTIVVKETPVYQITKKGVTITVTAGQNKNFGADEPETFAFTASVLVTNPLLDNTVEKAFSGKLIRQDGETAGTYALPKAGLTPTTSGLSSNNYTITSITSSVFTINPTPEVTEEDLDYTLPVEYIYDGNPYAVAVTPKIEGLGAITVKYGDDLRVAAPINAGEYTVTVDVAASANNAATTGIVLNGKLIIKARRLDVQATDQTKEVGQTDPVLSYTYTDLDEAIAPSTIGVPFTGKLTREEGETAGASYKIYNAATGGLTAGSNYVFTEGAEGYENGVKTATLTIGTAPVPDPTKVNVTIDSYTIVYGDAKPTWTYTASPAAGIATGVITPVTDTNVGVYDIIGTFTAADGYELGDVTIGKLTITPAPLTITAEAKSQVYGEAAKALTYTTSPTGVTLTGAGAREEGDNVGSYNILQGNLSAGANYTATYVGAKYTITPAALAITVASASKVYGAADPAFALSAPTTLPAGVTVAYSRAPGENVGTYAINAIVSQNGNNYTITNTPGTLTITQATVTVTADAQSKVYGAADPALTYESSVAGLSFTGKLTRVANENVGAYDITQGTLSAGANYTITYVGAKFTITPAKVTVTAEAKTKVYGEADPELTYVPTLALTFTGKLSRAEGENVGSYDITKGDLSAGDNYTIDYIGAKLVIKKADQVITFDALAEKEVGDAPFDLDATVSSGLPLSYASSNTSVATVDAATGEVTIIAAGQTTITVSQAGNDNYNAAASKSQVLVVKGVVGISSVLAPGEVSIYPNVTSRNTTIYLDVNVEKALLDKAEIAVYNLSGKLIDVKPVQGTITELTTPNAAGTYIYVVKAKDFSKTFKVLVK